MTTHVVLKTRQRTEMFSTNGASVITLLVFLLSVVSVDMSLQIRRLWQSVFTFVGRLITEPGVTTTHVVLETRPRAEMFSANGAVVTAR